MKNRRVLVILSILLLTVAAVAGCSSSNTSTASPGSGNGRMTGSGGPGSGGPGSGGPGSGGPGSGGPGSGGPGGNSGGNMMGGNGTAPSDFSSAGERIFLVGVGTDGQNIPRTAPRISQGSLMMGGGGCGSCHAADGRGGTIKMMTGTAIKTPDITYDALIKVGFTDDTIRKAVRDGLDESGKPLQDAMPRWQMSDADLRATVSYLKDLSAR